MTRAAVDVSGRPFFVWDVTFTRDKVGDFVTELFEEFFNALAQNAGITLHIANLYGTNNHHIAESCFKAVARALRKAVEMDPRQAGPRAVHQGNLEWINVTGSALPVRADCAPRTDHKSDSMPSYTIYEKTGPVG